MNEIDPWMSLPLWVLYGIQNQIFLHPFRGMLSYEIPAKNFLDWPLAFQSCAGHMFLFAGCLVARYLRKPFWLQVLESSHSLSLSHNPYNKFSQQIQGIQDWINYNQIWHGIKANTIHICKLQLYDLPLWLFRDKTPKTDSRLKREFGNIGKTPSHLI